MWTAYLAFNLAVSVSALGLWLLARLYPGLSSRTLLGLHYAAAAMSVVVSLLAPWLPGHYFATHVALATPVADPHPDSLFMSAARSGFDAAQHAWLPGADELGRFALVLAVLIGAGAALRGLADWRRLRSLRQRAQLLRRHGRVRVWIADHARTPFSFRSWGQAHVFIPQYVVARSDWYRMAIAHELQHHRQGDTAWLYFFGALQILCGLNPLAWTWNAMIARLQELACDEALLSRGRWPVSDYANGLLEVARAAAPHRGVAWAPSLIGARDSLKRRIEHMVNSNKSLPGVPARIAMFAGLLAGLTLTATAASSLTAEPEAARGALAGQEVGALPVRTGTLAARFEIPEEGAARRNHAGVDIAAPAGTPVYAWREGVITHAGERRGCGMSVVIQHWQGTRSLYCNLAKLEVTAGESVKRDQALGELADLGPSKKAHLHFEIELDGRNVDPARQVDLLALQ